MSTQAAPAGTQSPPAAPRSRLLGWAPYLIAAGLFALGLFALSHLLHEVHPREIVVELRSMPVQPMVLALASTLAGYLCLAGYDWSALRHIGKRLPGGVVLAGGVMAYAFGNTIGLAAISGSAVRWRLYARLGLDGYDIASISAFTALAFGVVTTGVGLASLAWHPDVLAAVLPLSANMVRAGAIVGLACIALPVVWASATHRSLTVGSHIVRAPRPSILGVQTLIGLGDITFASLTLYVLLPSMGRYR